MSDCGQTDTVRARKAHTCDWCREAIDADTTYIRASGIGDDRPYRFHLHTECEIAYLAAKGMCDCGDGCDLCDLAWTKRERGTILDDNDGQTISIVQALMRGDARRARERGGR
jgi:hypothetical protein